MTIPVSIKGNQVVTIMCPGPDIVTTGNCLVGVRGREKEEFDVGHSKAKLQVFVFYPNDWEDESLSLLSSFSSLHEQFLSSNCCLYGCSTDSADAHLNWIKTEFGSSLAFPLLSDITGQLADRFSLFDEEERINIRGIVITDSKGKEMEVINSSLESEELAKYTLNIVKNACKTPADEAKHRESGRLPRVEAERIKEPHATSNTNRSGFRSLDHIWSQVVDQGQEGPVVEHKRPKPAKIWGPTIGQNTDQSDHGNAGTQRPKPGKIWTPPTTQPVEQQPNGAPTQPAKPRKSWGAPAAPICPGCGRSVYPVDRVFGADRRHFHKSCIDCGVKGCQNKLTAKGLHKVGGLNLCSGCYNQQNRAQKVMEDIKKVEDIKQNEAKEMQERMKREEAMLELRTAIGGGARPGQA